MKPRDFKDKTKNKKVILLGETHGTREIPSLVFRLLRQTNEKINFCIEIPKRNQKEMNLFLKKNIVPSYFQRKPTDGRNSFEILNLIKKVAKLGKIKNKKIEIHCIDKLAKTQNEKEKNLAKEILELSKDAKTIVLVGEFHALTKKRTIEKKKITPTGKILKEKLKKDLISIRIAPEKGRHFNFGIKEIEENAPSDSNFDEVIKIKKVTPSTFIKRN